MKALYRQCDLCALATEIEACPNIAIEAMTAGCVIVSADKPPLPEIFQDASIFYEARNIAHLAEQMQLGLKDDRLRDDMRSKAKKRAESFSWAKCAGETYNALTDWS
jgi:glycosyltransferase involved in cell wall biosynthesis